MTASNGDEAYSAMGYFVIRSIAVFQKCIVVHLLGHFH